MAAISSTGRETATAKLVRLKMPKSICDGALVSIESCNKTTGRYRVKFKEAVGQYHVGTVIYVYAEQIRQDNK